MVDAAGKPVPEAMVVVTCPDYPEEVTRGATFSDKPGKPATSTFNYEIAIRKKGFGSTTMPLAAGQPIPRPLVIRLQRINQIGE